MFKIQKFPELILVKSEKGDVTVLLKKDQYLELALNHLNDETYYKKKLTKFQLLIVGIQIKVNILISDLHKMNFI